MLVIFTICYLNADRQFRKKLHVLFFCNLLCQCNIYYTICNRSKEKAVAVAEEIKEKTGFQQIRCFGNEEIESVLDRRYLAIQCTNVGMHPNTEQVVIDNPELYQAIHTGYDLIFNPIETRFMKMVKQAGGKAYCGLKMLLYQGIIAYELWNQVSVSEEQALEIYDLMKKTMGIE